MCTAVKLLLYHTDIKGIKKNFRPTQRIGIKRKRTSRFAVAAAAMPRNLLHVNVNYP